MRHNALRFAGLALSVGSLATVTGGCEAYVDDLGIQTDGSQAAADVYARDFQRASSGEQFMFQYLGPAKVIVDNPVDVKVRDRNERQLNRTYGRDVPILEYKFNTDCLRGTIYDLTTTPVGLNYFVEKSEYYPDSFIIHPTQEGTKDPDLEFFVSEDGPTLTPADSDTRDVLDDHGCLYGNWGTPFLESERRAPNLAAIDMYTTYVD